jgi:T5SS/PEP-CTERM-associated repeat protein
LQRLDSRCAQAYSFATIDALHAAAIVVLVSLLSTNSFAATRSWDGGGGADTSWRTDANWSSDTEPGVNDTAEFDRGVGFLYDVTFPLLLPPGDITTDRLIVGSNTVTFEPDHSNTDYIAGTSDTTETGRGIIIGEDANDFTAFLNSHLGLLSTAAATLGHVAGSSGTLTLNQNNNQFNVTGSNINDTELIIGRYGTGALNVSGGADVNVANEFGSVILGDYEGSNGTAIIDGAGSTLTVGSALFVGRGGTGTMNVLAGGTVTNGFAGEPDDLASARIGPGVVTVDGTGSTWISAQYLMVGSGDTGTMNVLNGGNVSSRSGFIGWYGVGEVTVDGAGSTWNNTSALYVDGGGPGTLHVTNGGRAQANYVDVGPFGEIHGDGDIVGYVVSGGLISPGTTTGALHVDGDYAQSDIRAGQTYYGELLIELASGSSYDQLIVSNRATLFGTLTVSLLDGFIPSVGQSFTIVTANDIYGTFATETLPSVPNLAFDVIYNAQSVVLTVLSALPGDYNEDGAVDAADYVVWRKTDGTQERFNTWRANFGSTAASGNGSSVNSTVPEPPSLIMLVIAVVTAYSVGRMPARIAFR